MKNNTNIPKILQAKRDGTFYEYCEELLSVDLIYGNMTDEELQTEEEESLKDLDQAFSAQILHSLVDRYEELI